LQNPKVKPQDTTRYIAAISDGSQTRYDTTGVNIVMALAASAGNDTIVCSDVSPVPLYGTAVNYSKIAWGTAGDGYFSNSSALVTNYFPGIQDITSGSVDLMLLALPIAPCVVNSHTMKHIVFDPCTGILEHPFNELKLAVQPNPAHGKVFFKITGLQHPGVITITNLEGRIVYSTKIDPDGKRPVSEQLDVSSYAKGVYLITLRCEDEVTYIRFIVQ